MDLATVIGIVGANATIVMKTLRAAIFGTFNSPPLFESCEILTKEEVLNRIVVTSKSDIESILENDKEVRMITKKLMIFVCFTKLHLLK